MMENKIYEVLDSIRDECTGMKKCKGCRFSCKYYVVHNEIRETRFACVLNEAPYRWQLETMEGFNNGQ